MAINAWPAPSSWDPRTCIRAILSEDKGPPHRLRPTLADSEDIADKSRERLALFRRTGETSKLDPAV
jgi:hypothetical protein